jgi:hypothetical protein
MSVCTLSSILTCFYLAFVSCALVEASTFYLAGSNTIEADHSKSVLVVSRHTSKIHLIIK